MRVPQEMRPIAVATEELRGRNDMSESKRRRPEVTLSSMSQGTLVMQDRERAREEIQTYKLENLKLK